MVQSRLGVILLLKVHTLHQLLFIAPQVLSWKRKTRKRASACHQCTVFIAQSPASWKCCVSASSGRVRQAYYFGLFDRGCWISDRFLPNGLKHPSEMCIRKLMPAVSLPHLLQNIGPTFLCLQKWPATIKMRPAHITHYWAALFFVCVAAVTVWGQSALAATASCFSHLCALASLRSTRRMNPPLTKLSD